MRFHVLHRMDGEIDPVAAQRLLDFLCEQPLAADLAQRAALFAVAGGADRHDLDGIGSAQMVMRGLQRRLCHLGLDEGEPAAARADAQHAAPDRGSGHGGSISRPFPPMQGGAKPLCHLENHRSGVLRPT